MSGEGDVLPILSNGEAERWLARRRERTGHGEAVEVDGILRRVRAEGDRALLELTERHDGVRPDALGVPPARCRAALEALPARRREALERARRNLERFHAAQRREEPPLEVEPGVVAWREFRPIDRVGLYVPGGRAAYPSSLLMTAVPARVAGCGELVACSPPGPSGLPAEPVMATAALLGVDRLFSVGGAQAIGALAYGTGSVPAVDKVFGPGNRWVDTAKAAVASDVAVDLPAGPSEVAVWMDAAADPDRAALELAAQAEHGPDSLAVAVVPDHAVAEAVARAAADRLEGAGRAGPIRATFARSAILVAADEPTSSRWINALAPEHLVILRADEEAALAEVRHAGSVFLGADTPVAAGDYATGTNHVLPTGTRARGSGGLSLDDFGRWIQVQRLEPDGLRALGPTIVELARWEGLPAHADSVTERLGGAS